MIPITLRFDSEPNVQGASVVRFPKLCQDAPYSFGLKVKLENNSYRAWDAYDIRWRIKQRPADTADLLTLMKNNGNFTVEGDQLNFIVRAEDWVGVELPRSSNHLEMDVPFSFVVEFLDAAGFVTERFAHGNGLITVSLDV